MIFSQNGQWSLLNETSNQNGQQSLVKMANGLY